jgi:hypothetical protein
MSQPMPQQVATDTSLEGGDDCDIIEIEESDAFDFYDEECAPDAVLNNSTPIF